MNSPNRKTLSSSFLVFVSACIAIALMLSCGSYAFADEIASSRSVDEPAVIIDTPSKIGTSGAVEAKPSSEPSENGSSSSASQAGDSNAIAPAIDTQNTPDSSVKKDEKTVGMASKPQSEVTGETKSASAGALVDETSSSAKASVKAESHAKVDAVEKTTDEAAIDSAKPMAKSAAKPAPKSDPAENCVNMIRLYNPNSGEHFYTSSEKEAENVTRAGWVWEGVGWVAPKKSSFPVYRLYNPNAGDHHYTVSVKERNSLRSKGWIYEGVGWYSHDESGLAVLRQYNPNAVAGAHNFTTSEVEDRALARIGWIPEGIAWRAVDGVKLPFEPRWLTTLTSHGREWQWVASDAQVAKDRLITPEEGAGCYSYARPDGCIVRGKWDNGHARVYVADKNGVLASTPDGKDGWLVTKKYDGGWQRYYYIGSDHAMRTSFFKVDGKKYYGVGGQGYVLRNDFINQGSTWYHSDNDGVLTKSTPPAHWYMNQAAQGLWSATDKLIMINLSTAMMGIYSGSQGNWSNWYYWLASPGKPSTPTVTGTFSTLSRKPHLSTAYTARWCTQFYGAYFIHSILGTGNELGSYRYLSHGCVRVDVDNARWIYDNVPLGTTVHVYY